MEVLMKTNTKYLIGVVAVVLVIAGIAAFGMTKSPTDDNNSAATAAPMEQLTTPIVVEDPNAPASPEKTEAPLVLPTFMYFVSKNDASYDEAKKVYDELAAEYEGRVKFELKDVDENPELKEKFMINIDSPIPMHTPTLIMLDVHNDLSTIGLSECTDKEVLKNCIEKALNVK